MKKSLDIQPDINKAQIANLYQEAQIELAEMVLRRLDELEAFNAKLLLNRSTKLKEEKKHLKNN